MNKITVPDVIPIVKAYKQKPGNSIGGSLHIVLDDGNIDEKSVKFCAEWAKARGDVDGENLGRILLSMSKTQRKKLSFLFYEI